MQIYDLLDSRLLVDETLSVLIAEQQIQRFCAQHDIKTCIMMLNSASCTTFLAFLCSAVIREYRP